MYIYALRKSIFSELFQGRVRNFPRNEIRLTRSPKVVTAIPHHHQMSLLGRCPSGGVRAHTTLRVAAACRRGRENACALSHPRKNISKTPLSHPLGRTYVFHCRKKYTHRLKQNSLALLSLSLKVTTLVCCCGHNAYLVI